MRVSIPRSMLAGLAALVSLALSSLTIPASAATWHGGGGFGGWHGGGGWPGGGWNGGWRGGYGWRGYGYGGWGCCGWGWGYAGWGYPWGWGYGGWDYPPDYYYLGAGYYGGGSGCWTYRKVWTQPGGRGRYLGRRRVNVCH
jgi:hypothetical protein